MLSFQEIDPWLTIPKQVRTNIVESKRSWIKDYHNFGNQVILHWSVDSLTLEVVFLPRLRLLSRQCLQHWPPIVWKRCQRKVISTFISLDSMIFFVQQSSRNTFGAKKSLYADTTCDTVPDKGKGRMDECEKNWGDWILSVFWFTLLEFMKLYPWAHIIGIWQRSGQD